MSQRVDHPENVLVFDVTYDVEDMVEASFIRIPGRNHFRSSGVLMICAVGMLMVTIGAALTVRRAASHYHDDVSRYIIAAGWIGIPLAAVTILVCTLYESHRAERRPHKNYFEPRSRWHTYSWMVLTTVLTLYSLGLRSTNFIAGVRKQLLDKDREALLIIVCVMLALPLLVYIQRRLVRSRMRSVLARFPAARVVLDDEAITLDFESQTVRLTWRSLSRFIETPRTFMLLSEDNYRRVLPKQSIAPETIVRLRDMLEEKFPSATGGFPVLR